MRLFRPLLNDLQSTDAASLRADLSAALVVLFMAIPQGVAYAVIAGLPPAAGIYAATFPAVVGSLFRSSRHVITGPTNALSLLVGGAMAGVAVGIDPVQVGVTLAFLVGLFQVAAGLLRLGSVVDYISSPVVLGYITGAAVLIAIGQLPSLTGTVVTASGLLGRLLEWAGGLGGVEPLTLGLGLATAAGLLLLRRWVPRLPGPLVVMVAGSSASLVLDLESRGVAVVANLAPVPGSLPPLTLPSPELVALLLPVALAATVLSLVESTSVARTLAARTGDRLDASAGFLALGMGNLTAAFCGGYPVSGTLSRSVVNHRAGARTRLSGVISGALMLLALLTLGPLIDATPVASLAGLLLVVAWDLVDGPRIRRAVKAGGGDAVAFGGTLLGTWTLALDQAILLGVGLSIVLFLRRARLLVARELVVGPEGRLQEAELLREVDPTRSCVAVRVLHIEGPLFFGAAGELQAALDDLAAAPDLQVLIVRMKRTQGLDATTLQVLESTSSRLRETGRALMLVGLRPEEMAVLKRTGAVERLGAERLFPTQETWFLAMEQALVQARSGLRGHPCKVCPLGPEGRGPRRVSP